MSSGVLALVAGTPGYSTYGGDGGQASAAQLSNPHAMAMSSLGDLYIADNGNNRIRKVIDLFHLGDLHLSEELLLPPMRTPSRADVNSSRWKAVANPFCCEVPFLIVSRRTYLCTTTLLTSIDCVVCSSFSS